MVQLQVRLFVRDCDCVSMHDDVVSGQSQEVDEAIHLDARPLENLPQAHPAVLSAPNDVQVALDGLCTCVQRRLQCVADAQWDDVDGWDRASGKAVEGERAVGEINTENDVVRGDALAG